MSGGIVFAALFLFYKMQMAAYGVWESFVPLVGALATLTGAFYGKKKLDKQNNQQRQKREED